MKTLLLLTFVILSVTAHPATQKDDADERQPGRIIHGTPAVLGQFPWQAYVVTQRGLYYYLCGGALIDQFWVLTAGHCTQNGDQYWVRLGSLNASSGGIVVTSTTAFTHESYNKTPNINNNNHDIGLIKLPFAVNTAGPNIKTIPLLPNDMTVLNKLQISGWGKTSDTPGSTSKFLMFENVQQVSYFDCSNFYGSGSMTPQTMCVNATSDDPLQSTCFGDSGGPVVMQGTTTYLVALVSFGYKYSCELGYPTGHTRVVPYKTWIKNRTGLSL